MTPHLVFTVHEPSGVGEARRAAANLARESGFDETAVGRLSIVVTELGTNLARHAQHGRLLIARSDVGDEPAIDVLSLDEGPGMADVQACLRDGFSTSGTPGTGLGAVKRLSSSFEVFSQIGTGTIIAVKVGRAVGELDVPNKGAASGPRFSVAAICLAAPGETVSGDGWAVARRNDRLDVMVADGLGHGPDAAKASDEALRVFEKVAVASPSEVLDRAHTALRGTRGAAVAVAQLEASTGMVTYCGAGNIAGRVISGLEDRSLMSQHGTIGLQVRKLQDIQYAWPEHALVVLLSDGLATRWNFKEVPELLQCHPVIIAAWLIRGHCRGRDDATVVVVRRD